MPRAGLTRDAVVRLAVDVVEERGLDALSLAAVAQRAGVAVPSLYKHVAGLPDLRRAVAVVAVRALAEALDGASDLHEVGRAVRRHAHLHPGLYAAAQSPALHPEPDGEAGRADADELAARSAQVVALVAAGLGPGERTAEEQVHAVRALRAAVHGFVDLELTGGFGLPEDVDASFERLLDALVRGLAPVRAGS